MVLTPWRYNGRPVKINHSIEAPDFLSPSGQGGALVQTALDLAPAWPRGERRPIWHIAFSNLEIQPSAIAVTEGMVRFWGKHQDHHPTYAEPSPFVELPAHSLPKTNILTLEMTGDRHWPVLKRVYFGPRVPPLPWMNAAVDAPEGWRGCFNYWRAHAYLRSPLNDVRPGTLTTETPAWWPLERP